MSLRSTSQRLTSGGRTSHDVVNSNALPPVSCFVSGDGKREKPSRGGGLRVGKVITDARAVIHSGGSHQNEAHPYTTMSSARIGPTSGSRVHGLDGEETRVQDEMIEMLTMRLAKKEKETELLRLQQTGHDTQRNQLESRIADLERELQETKENLSSKAELAQREAQQARVLADRFRMEAESQRVSLQELRRQRERDCELARSKELQLQRQAEELRRELALLRSENQSLDDRVKSGLNDLDTAKERVNESELRRSELEALLMRFQESERELSQQLEVSRAAVVRLEDHQRILIVEKQTLEDKVQQLSRTLRELTARASETERRKSDLTQAETHLTKQLTQLHRENEELKARNGQLQSQTKQQQARLVALESAKATSDTKLKEASEEVAQARKRLREHQFRIQQLQEEIQFQTKKKSTLGAQPKPTPPVAANATPLEAVSTTSSTPTGDRVVPCHAAPSGGSDSIPSWMRD